ncbi:hypothetical protein ACFXK0_24400 [Nocardia sp. NPDC059177]|uniref:hypothetical protein n=1 Tax=Nocardia sp. NPDC059177 TaxID=3346759 RepID=UPI00368ED96F
MRATDNQTTDQPTERPDLTAWRRRHALRSSAAATAVPSGRTYRRSAKHRDRRYE